MWRNTARDICKSPGKLTCHYSIGCFSCSLNSQSTLQRHKVQKTLTMAAVRGAELLIRLINIFILSHTHTHQYQTDKPYCFLKIYSIFCLVSPLSPPPPLCATWVTRQPEVPRMLLNLLNICLVWALWHPVFCCCFLRRRANWMWHANSINCSPCSCITQILTMPVAPSSTKQRWLWFSREIHFTRALIAVTSRECGASVLFLSLLSPPPGGCHASH